MRLWLAVALALVTGLLPAREAGAATERSCRDRNGAMPGTWVARYDVRPSGYGNILTVSFLGFRPDGSSVTTEYQSSNWTISWLPVDPAPFQPRGKVTGSNATIYDTDVAVYLFPRVVSPTGRCTIYLGPYSYVSASGPKVALVGDSITYDFSRSLTERQDLGRYYAGFGRQVEADGQSGNTWLRDVRSDGLPVPEGVNMRDEIRGLLSSGASTVVVHLGVNDAFITQFPEKRPYQQNLRQSTQDNMVEAIHDIGSSRCAVLVTPSDHPSSIFPDIPPEAYAAEARNIVNLARFFAGLSGTDRVTLVDWAEISRSHHLPDGTNGDWFPDGDEVHPNTAGQLSLIDAVGRGAQACTPA